MSAPSRPLLRSDITGLVLAGGRGSRMGGEDKGLLVLDGQTLAERAAARLAPQVASVALNANRNAARYAAFGHPVWPDADGTLPGPLAGFLAGLQHCTTDYLATVACDTPDFPPDLVARLAAALHEAGADMAMAALQVNGAPKAEPVFCLLHVSLRGALAAALTGGERRVRGWALQQRCVDVVFDEPAAFVNVNTPEELAARASRSARPVPGPPGC